MLIPEKVIVGGKTYIVKDNYAFIERDDVAGQTDHVINEIRIARTRGQQERALENVEETVIHEIVHCVDLVFCSNAVIDKLGENVISALGQGLYQALRDSGLLREE